MAKLTLDLDSLEVATFQTASQADSPRGTVAAQAGTLPEPILITTWWSEVFCA